MSHLRYPGYPQKKFANWVQPFCHCCKYYSEQYIDMYIINLLQGPIYIYMYMYIINLLQGRIYIYMYMNIHER